MNPNTHWFNGDQNLHIDMIRDQLNIGLLIEERMSNQVFDEGGNSDDLMALKDNLAWLDWVIQHKERKINAKNE